MRFTRMDRALGHSPGPDTPTIDGKARGSTGTRHATAGTYDTDTGGPLGR